MFELSQFSLGLSTSECLVVIKNRILKFFFNFNFENSKTADTIYALLYKNVLHLSVFTFGIDYNLIIN